MLCSISVKPGDNCVVIWLEDELLHFDQLNSSSRSVTYMCQWVGSTLFQIMAFRLFGAKPLSKPMLDYCWLDTWNKFQLTFYQNATPFIHKMHMKASSAKWRPLFNGEMGWSCIHCYREVFERFTRLQWVKSLSNLNPHAWTRCQASRDGDTSDLLISHQITHCVSADSINHYSPWIYI